MSRQFPSVTLTALPMRRSDNTSRRQLTILVVEDQDALRLAVSNMLRKEGFSVIEASDGTVAVDLIRTRKHHIDVLLLDVSLTGASSREVFKIARKVIPGVTVIVTTAYSEEESAEWLAAKVEHFIWKPYRLSELLDLIRKTAS